jgi:hypothetical protein
MLVLATLSISLLATFKAQINLANATHHNSTRKSRDQGLSIQRHTAGALVKVINSFPKN